jgi:hypothetical protein
LFDRINTYIYGDDVGYTWSLSGFPVEIGSMEEFGGIYAGMMWNSRGANVDSTWKFGHLVEI